MDSENEELDYYYPTSDLVTAPDILFFWVARMIIAGYEYRGKKPFENVYLTGIVRDAQGRKMSKSLGNSPDPIMLMEKYGADGVRMGLMMAAPAGNDVLFDESLSEQGRNFCNKIWNAFRLVKGWEQSEVATQPEASALAVKWFGYRLDEVKVELDDLFSKYRLSEALTLLYKLFWDDFSSWYLEMVKPAYGQPMDARTYHSTVGFFDQLLRLLHPFMPFITEELWHALEPRLQGETIMLSYLLDPQEIDKDYLRRFDRTCELIAAIRNIRMSKNIPFKEKLVLETAEGHDSTFDAVVIKMAGLECIRPIVEKSAASASFLIGTQEYAIPMGALINVEEEIKKLSEELAYQEKFLASVMKKLGNESFVSKAPEAVIALERKKQSDAEARIATLRESLQQMQSGK